MLGLSYQDLGLGVAKTWGLPDSLQKIMRKPLGDPPAQVINSPSERQRWLAAACNEMADVMIKADAGSRSKAVADVAKRYFVSLGIKPKDIEAATSQAQQKLAALAKAMGLQLHKSSSANSLLKRDAPLTGGSDTHSLSPHELQTNAVSRSSSEERQVSAPATNESVVNRSVTGALSADVMAAGIQDITNSMVEDFKLNEVLRMILETMYRALDFRRVIFCLRDPKTNALSGRFGLGEDAAAVAKAFKVPFDVKEDLFSAICLKGMDTLISDTSVGTVSKRLPDWYRKAVNAPCFLLLPMQMKGSTFALIYADKAVPGLLTLDEKELSLLRTLRNQGVMAFKQVG